MIISNIWRHVVTTKTIKKINDNSLFLLLLLTHSSTQWRKSSNSSLHVSFVHGLLFTRSLHSCKRCLVFSHAWSSPHSSFNFVNGSYIIREKQLLFSSLIASTYSITNSFHFFFNMSLIIMMFVSTNTHDYQTKTFFFNLKKKKKKKQ